MKKLIVLLYFLTCQAVMGERLPEYISTVINDYADLIPADEEAALGQKLIDLREKTGVEMVVVTVQSRADYDHGGNLGEFSTDLFNSWGIGDVERNDGVLILVIKRDREMRIELGAGYDQGFDRAAAWVISETFLPEFRKENYPRGITSGVAKTISEIVEPHLRGEVPDISIYEPEPKGWFARYWLLIVAAIGAFMIKFRKKIGRVVPSFKKCPQCGAHRVTRERNILEKATKETVGHGELTQGCRNCNYTRQSRYKISKSRARSSGSRRSFGGGRSSGGGASGKW